MRHYDFKQWAGAYQISIHAPIKDATMDTVGLFIEDVAISIHAPIKDATPNISVPNASLIISIHAPIKDATLLMGQLLLQAAKISIHAPIKDATSQFCIRHKDKILFQFTHP